MASPWRKIFGRSAPAGSATMAAAPAAQKFALTMPSDLIAAITGGGTLAPKIARNEAMQVPAVMRARNLIAGSISKLPLTVLAPDYTPVPPYAIPGQTGGPNPVTYLVNTPPDPEVPQAVTMAMTVEDMLFEGVAWWQITARGWHGYPTEARWVPHSSVLVAQTHGLPPSRLIISPDELFPTPGDGGQVYIDGRPVNDADVIRFDSPLPPMLRHGSRAIRTCLLLDMMVALYAKNPVPLGILTDADPDNPADEAEVPTMLDQWAAAQQTNAWPYLPGLKPNPLSWNPEQLQLADQRQHAVLEIARAAGVDPDYLGVAVASKTYANTEDRRQDLVDFTLDPFLTAIEQRLSMRDCLPRGYTAYFEREAFVRGDTLNRMQTYVTGKQVGAYTIPEIRRRERKPPLTAAEIADIIPKPAPGEPVDQPSTPADQPPPADTQQEAAA